MFFNRRARPSNSRLGNTQLACKQNQPFISLEKISLCSIREIVCIPAFMSVPSIHRPFQLPTLCTPSRLSSARVRTFAPPTTVDVSTGKVNYPPVDPIHKGVCCCHDSKNKFDLLMFPKHQILYPYPWHTYTHACSESLLGNMYSVLSLSVSG